MNESIQNNLIPHFIYQKYRAGIETGKFYGVTLYMDISGFTQMTQHFMAHGKEGAESLAGIINTIFDPIISSIYAHGGFVAGFAGDALTVIFPSNDRQTAINACQTTFDIQQVVAKQAKTKISLGQFALEVKLGLGAGLVEWGIIGPLAHRTYFFRGTAVSDCVKAEGFADEGEIILAPSLQHYSRQPPFNLKRKTAVLPNSSNNPYHPQPSPQPYLNL